MGRGKAAVQVAHAAVLAALEVQRSRPRWFREWLESGQAKVAVKVHSLEELLTTKRLAEGHRLPVVLVEDRGLTQLAPGTVTCVGIGPAPSSKIDLVTGNLQLL